MNIKLPMAGGGRPVERPGTSRRTPQREKRAANLAQGFTLVELLAVIAIIGVVVALTIPAVDAIKRQQVITQTRAQMEKLNAAIASYHTANGYYPPGGSGNGLVNQLYYELSGVIITNNGTKYNTLDGTVTISVSDVPIAFPGVAGFVNCSKPGAGEESPAGRKFISGLRPNETANYTANGVPITILIGSAGGPDPSYQPLGQTDVNPWRYRYPGVNNPNGYDLWMQLSFFEKTYLICNWSKTVQNNSPLP
jgi:prepilin-type N-terminal cleavage/methylation domain-containing protein